MSITTESLHPENCSLPPENGLAFLCNSVTSVLKAFERNRRAVCLVFSTLESAMTVKAGYSTPMLHVAEIENSIRFYELLGFTTIDTDRCVPIGWARLHCEDGSAVMFLRAEHPINSSVQAFMFYMYTPDLAGLREHLLANDVKAPPINYPEYMPSGKINIADPDGYKIEIGHWGKSEQEAWEKRLKANPKGSS